MADSLESVGGVSLHAKSDVQAAIAVHVDDAPSCSSRVQGAAEHQAGLLVACSFRRRGLRRARLGSTTDGLISRLSTFALFSQ